MGAETKDSEAAFGELLRQYRVAAELSQEALAERAHMSARGVSDLERGVRTKPYRGTVEQLASALELSAPEQEALERAARRVRESPPPPTPDVGGSEAETLLATKLAVPPARAQLVPRPHLLERLEAGLQGSLTLLAAPPGSGKTTLLSAWRASPAGQRVPVAWVSLDARDNDIARFRRYVLAALDAAGVDVGAECRALLRLPQPVPSEVVLTTFVNVISAMTTDVVLILDDFHVIDNQALLLGLAFLLEHLPAQLHFVLATRADPPLPLARLRAAGRITELRAADLRFSREETAEFLTGIMGLPLTSADIDLLETRTEGWIAGLQLAALSLQSHPELAATDFIASFAGSHRHVIDYLTDEVLARLPRHVHDFILHTSILDRLSASLCAYVMDEESSTEAVLACGELLEELERRNLFLVALDERREWYRYHHLFAEALRHNFRRLEPGRVEEVHLRASEWFERYGLIQDAIEHALEGRSFERAATLIEREGHTLLEQSANDTLWRFLDRLPENVVAEHPPLCITKAWFLLDGGFLERGERWLDAAERASTSEMTTERRRNRQGEIAAARAFAASMRGDPDEVIARTEVAFRDLRDDNLLTRGLAGLALGRAYMARSELAQAAKSYADAAEIVRRTGNAPTYMRAIFGQSQMERAQGHLRRAMAICRDAIAWSAERGHPYPGVGMTYLALADMAREQNELETARQLAREGAELCSRVAYELDAQIYPRRVLALIEEASGNLDAALHIVHEAETVISAAEPVHSLAGWHLCEARLRLLQGNLAAALTCVETAVQEKRHDQDAMLSLPFMRGREQLLVIPVQVMIGQGRATDDPTCFERALTLLEDSRVQADRLGAVWLQIKTRVLQALALRGLGDSNRARPLLEEALTLGQPEGYVRVFVDEGSPLAPLLRELAPDDNARVYVATLLSALDSTQ